MKLQNIEFFLKWPHAINLVDLREFILKNILKKGDIVRWYISDIKNSQNSINEKILLINAVIIIH